MASYTVEAINTGNNSANQNPGKDTLIITTSDKDIITVVISGNGSNYRLNINIDYADGSTSNSVQRGSGNGTFEFTVQEFGITLNVQGNSLVGAPALTVGDTPYIPGGGGGDPGDGGGDPGDGDGDGGGNPGDGDGDGGGNPGDGDGDGGGNPGDGGGDPDDDPDDDPIDPPAPVVPTADPPADPPADPVDPPAEPVDPVVLIAPPPVPAGPPPAEPVEPPAPPADIEVLIAPPPTPLGPPVEEIQITPQEVPLAQTTIGGMAGFFTTGLIAAALLAAVVSNSVKKMRTNEQVEE